MHDVLLLAGDTVGRLHPYEVAPPEGDSRAVATCQLMWSARAAWGLARALGLSDSGLVGIALCLGDAARHSKPWLLGMIIDGRSDKRYTI